ncbi:hypothetical protein [Modestobacter sp. I12A-02662]
MTVGGAEVRAALRAASGVLARDPDGTTALPATGLAPSGGSARACEG